MPDKDPAVRKFDAYAKRELREWCVAQAACEWEKLHVGETLHNHLGEIIRVADAFYKYIATGKIDQADRYRPRD